VLDPEALLLGVYGPGSSDPDELLDGVVLALEVQVVDFERGAGDIGLEALVEESLVELVVGSEEVGGLLKAEAVPEEGLGDEGAVVVGADLGQSGLDQVGVPVVASLQLLLLPLLRLFALQLVPQLLPCFVSRVVF